MTLNISGPFQKSRFFICDNLNENTIPDDWLYLNAKFNLRFCSKLFPRYKNFHEAQISGYIKGIVDTKEWEINFCNSNVQK